MAWMSRRSTAVGSNAAISTDQPLATLAGIDILKNGGTAADAAICAAAVLNVTQPFSCGLGGDAWILYYDAAEKRVTCLNGSGRSGARFTPELLKERNLESSISPCHPLTITVPGAAATWCDLHEKFGGGKFTLSELFKPAIETATTGFAVPEMGTALWKQYFDFMEQNRENATLPDHFKPPHIGDVRKFSGLARAYEELGSGGKSAFYEGRIARDIVDCVQSAGGILTLEDLAAHKTDFVKPIYTTYRSRNNGSMSVKVWEPPANTQAVVTLEALNLLSNLSWNIFDDDAFINGAYHHAVLEALKLSFQDLNYYWKYRNQIKLDSDVYWQYLLDPNQAQSRSSLIQRNSISSIPATEVHQDHGDTTYFCVTDKFGNACSAVWSNYIGFGTPYCPTGWDFSLHSRGFHFWEFMHCQFAPSTRPFHTIMAGMLTDTSGDNDGNFLGAFGCMGGQNQPQGHLQVLLQMLEYGATPQEALDAPRMRISYDFATNQVTTYDEIGLPAGTVDALLHNGHKLNGPISGVERNDFGRGHVITKGAWWSNTSARSFSIDDDVFYAGCDPRGDSLAMAV